MMELQHFINGARLGGDTYFEAPSHSGEIIKVVDGDQSAVDAALEAANEACVKLAAISADRMALLLTAIANQIDASKQEIADITHVETALPIPRLIGECARTSGQLRLFANLVSSREHLEFDKVAALPNREPAPRPQLTHIQRPIGPVVVFGASNFPLAFSTAGGDTASALAAGCPVIVKAHPAHPLTGDLMATIISKAIEENGFPPAAFQMLQGSNHNLSRALVEHPLTAGVGFTGSLGAGRTLFDCAMRREIPIPFYGEFGSVNPVFVLPEAAASQGSAIGRAWAASLSGGVGQFCTKPGILVIPNDSIAIKEAALNELKKCDAHPMLTTGIAENFTRGAKRAIEKGATRILGELYPGRAAQPVVVETTADQLLSSKVLKEEVFGPFGLIVKANPSEMMRIAKSFEGQLTATIHAVEEDHSAAKSLISVLEWKAGRIIMNGFPTGVEVSSAMVHGGPYPASSNFGQTSVGSLSIRRWMRSVCFQNVPESLVSLV